LSRLWGPLQTIAKESRLEDEIDYKQALAEEVNEYEISEVVLLSPEEFDYEPEITESDRAAAKPIDEALSALQGYYAEDQLALNGERAFSDQEAEQAGLPASIDHRSTQGPIKSQGTRGTCVAHASVALLESFLHIPDDLSEQYVHYKFNEFIGRPQNRDQGLRTTDAAGYLARQDGRTCLEAEWPYIPLQATIDTLVSSGTYGPPAAARANQSFGYGSGAYKIIPDRGERGESIKNTRYLEALLYQGYNPVIGTWVSWDDKDNNGILDPVLDSSGKPIGEGGHAMLLVGYNRSEQYFIVKNSWGPGWGHRGYGFLHYNLVRSCFKYGFVVDQVVPEEPPTPLPSQLARAPFSTRRISRSQLRAAILFAKTSRGRYAVCEAYAGYNLLLRNLRVYNPNGSIHLERDSVVVRGTYLFDFDSARETRYDADFWWEAVRPGVNYLVPRNGATACIGFNLAHLRANQITQTELETSAVPSDELNYAVIVGRTTARRPFKILVHAKSDNRLQISYLEVYDHRGRRYRYSTNVTVPSSWTYNLDTLKMGGGKYADIWWHVISDNVGFLEHYSNARMELLWSL
jgi:C1A family cysteine protease